jgi:hypothetical protein
MADEAEPTELAGVAEAPTESAYAWGLDYEDEIARAPVHRAHLMGPMPLSR